VPTLSTCTSGCQNGGTCVTDASSEGTESRCSCPENYIGSDCSEAISCTNDVQCSGNNTCKLYQGQNYCDCGDGTTGFFCKVSSLPGESSSLCRSLCSLMYTVREKVNHFESYCLYITFCRSVLPLHFSVSFITVISSCSVLLSLTMNGSITSRENYSALTTLSNTSIDCLVEIFLACLLCLNNFFPPPDTRFSPDDGIPNFLHYWAFNIIPFGRRFVDKIGYNHFTRYGTCVFKATHSLIKQLNELVTNK
jgi:hypothetical protein